LTTLAEVSQWAEEEVTRLMRYSLCKGQEVGRGNCGKDGFNDFPLPDPDPREAHDFGVNLRMRMREYLYQEFKSREELMPIIEKIALPKSSTGVDLAYALALILDRIIDD